jgi:hypothetical protein
MSGLLKRLARQAIGGGRPSIRPLVSRTIVGIEPVVEQAAVEPEPNMPLTRPAPQGSPAKPSAEQAQATINSPPVDALLEPDEAAQPTSAPARSHPTASPTPTTDPVQRDVTEPLESPAISAPPRDIPVQPVQPAGLQDDRDRSAVRELPSEVVATSKIDRVEIHAAAWDDGPTKDTESPGTAARAGIDQPAKTPEPLLPVTSDDSRIQARVSPTNRATSDRLNNHITSDSEPNEVHVHIGQIEFTAVHESAPPAKKKPRERRQPMSLDDYLAQRQRSRS